MSAPEVEHPPGDENDDSWLYGDSNPDQQQEKAPEISNKQPEGTNGENGANEAEETEQQQEDNEGNDDSHFNDEHFAEVSRDEGMEGDADSQDNGDEDSDDSDEIQVTIGDIKSATQAPYSSLNIKRGMGMVPASTDKARAGGVAGKVTAEDMEGPGVINGIPAHEFNIDLEDKPWYKPGADISDYFNYGFNEMTWNAYCERQRKMRVNESGVGMVPGLTVQRPPAPDLRRVQPAPMRDEGPPPMMNTFQQRENTIQVMTAERREYGRMQHGRDAPPEFFQPPQPENYYVPPTFDEAWAHAEPPPGWAPSEIKELTPGPVMGPMGGMPGHPPGPPGMGPPPPMGYTAPFRPHLPGPPPQHQMPPHFPIERDRRDDRERRDRERDRREEEERERERERERDRERERSRSIKPDRLREKSYRRERSRSRSRRHRSRSRSPRHRERSRERERERSRDRDRDRDRSRDRERDRERDRSRDREERPREKERERSVKPKSKDQKEKEGDDK